MTIGRAALLGATILATGLGFAGSVWAQEAPADESTADNSNEIIVTARKQEERLQDAPTTVSVATADTIDRLGLDNLTDIAKTTPGLVFDDTFGRDANRPVIRGQANILGSSGVAYFIDGIYYSGSLADYDVDTIERIEVVKGPQSALYGRNTYSGAINLISKMPSKEWTGRVQADISEHDRYEFTAGVRGPLADGLGIALGARYYDNKGEFKNAYDGSRLGKQSTKSAYGNIRFDNGGPFRASLRANYNDTDDGQPAIFSQSANANNCFNDNGNLYRGRGRYFCGVIHPQTPSSDYKRQFVDPQNVGLEARTFNGAFRMDYDLTDQLTLTSLTGYNKRTANNKTDGDYSGNSFNLVIFAYTPGFQTTPAGPPRTRNVTLLSTSVQDFTFSNHVETKDVSQELRLAYDNDRLHVLVGGYYFDQSDDSSDTRVVPPGSLALAQANADAARARLCAELSYCASTTPLTITAASLPESRNTNFFDVTNKAVFGSVTFDVAEGFSLSAEGRYAAEKIRQTTVTVNNGSACVVTATNLCPRVVQKTFKEFTPRFTASWQASRDHLLYAVYAEGQKPGGFNSNQAIVAGFPTFDPEDNKTYELGSKNQFLNGQLTANLAVYHTKVKGYQITQNISVPPNQVSLTRNGGNARVNGAELELLMRPSRNFTVTANYSYVDAQFTAGSDENLGLIFDVADDGLVNCSQGDQFTDIAGCQSKFGSIKGKSIPRAPKHTAFVDVDWRQPVGGSDWTVFAGANVSMVSSSFDQVLNFAETGGSTVVDARLGVQNDRFKIQAYVKNLFDEDAIAQIIRYADANNDLRRNFIAGLRPGRRVGVIFSAGF
ncbi:TonB-dependent receptor [Novosphingobium sp. Gsoil 351]|uniref:TonB-dependent receptor n=1 Tax=Novosphingobium sp. Gsoil 351 TaxID=2675225 RepID=UPI0018A83AB0|nr:TonB-dependent receptor [Novosphingobium sp. Gsoil 351]